MNKATEKLKDKLLDLLWETEAILNGSGYMATDDDWELVEGKKTYSKAYLDKLPSEFSTMLGRHSAIMDLLDLIEKTERDEVQDILNKVSDATWDDVDELDEKLRRN